MTEFDLVIRNGRILDPANNIDDVQDLAVKDGKIAQLGTNLPKGRRDVDATDCIVTPGLIDIHTHVYEHATLLGVNPDDCCLARGVTTVVDAGSAGCMTFKGLRKFIGQILFLKQVQRVHTSQSKSNQVVPSQTKLSRVKPS